MRAPLFVTLLGSLWLSGIACSSETATSSARPASTSASTVAPSVTSSVDHNASAPSVSAAPTAPKTQAPEGMVHIPAGVFLMGAPKLRGNPEEKPAHEAIVASFFLDQYEVTHGTFMKCVKAGACKIPRLDHMYCNVKLELKGATDRDKYPANCIDLTHADSYCRWAGKRLPTEREWEYAATGGDRRSYSWGEETPTKANCCYDNPGSCLGGSFKPGAFGLYDMTGNVWEWTSSQFLPYPSPAKDEAISPHRRYVYRGGSWSRRFPKWMRTMLRNRYKPDGFSASIGVRCAKSITPTVCPSDTEFKDGACQRIQGKVLCEPGLVFRDGRCRSEHDHSRAAAPKGTWRRSTAKGPPRPSNSAESKAPVFTRSRTSQHDADCRRHWPKTPASYIFRGGKTYPSRKSTVAGAGCVPRDMGATWTSACCRQ